MTRTWLVVLIALLGCSNNPNVEVKPLPAAVAKINSCTVLNDLRSYDGQKVQLEGDLYFQFERSEFSNEGCKKVIWVDRSNLTVTAYEKLKTAWGRKTKATIVGKIHSKPNSLPYDTLGSGFGHLSAYPAEIILESASLVETK
jgi:hypothetical protein